MKASHWWMGEQSKDKRYPQPRMCASNVSKVLFLFEDHPLRSAGRPGSDHRRGHEGTLVVKMPQDKAGFLKKLAALHGGHIPAGTLVAGENVHSSKPGDQHVGFIGHTDADGTVWAYHNNWYRPENEKGERKPFMVSDENLKRGFPRQFMAVPWVKLTRNAQGNADRREVPRTGDRRLEPVQPGLPGHARRPFRGSSRTSPQGRRPARSRRRRRAPAAATARRAQGSNGSGG